MIKLGNVYVINSTVKPMISEIVTPGIAPVDPDPIDHFDPLEPEPLPGISVY